MINHVGFLTFTLFNALICRHLIKASNIVYKLITSKLYLSMCICIVVYIDIVIQFQIYVALNDVYVIYLVNLRLTE